MSIKKQILNNLKWSTIANSVISIGGLIQMFILISIISKAEFGIMAIAQLFFGLAALLIDLGISNAIIYKQVERFSHLNSFFWACFGMAVVLVIGFQGMAWLSSCIYDTAVPQELFSLLSLGLLFAGIGSIFQVILRLNQDVDVVWQNKLLSFIIGFVIVIGMAYEGYGVYALAGGIVVRMFVEMIQNVRYGSKYFWPSFSISFQETGYYFRFGMYQLLERSINYLHNQLDVILLGKFISIDALGVYDIFKRILVKPYKLINPVATSTMLPYMSSFKEDDSKKDKIYLQQISILALLNFVVYVSLFVHSELIMTLLFDETWSEYEWVFKYLVILYGAYSIGNPMGTLLMSKGKKELSLFWNIFMLSFVTLAVWWGGRDGVEGVALWLSITHVGILMMSYFVVIGRISSISARAFFSPLMVALMVGLLTGISSYGLSSLMDPSWLKVVVVMLISILTFGVLIYFFKKDVYLFFKNYISSWNGAFLSKKSES